MTINAFQYAHASTRPHTAAAFGALWPSGVSMRGSTLLDWNYNDLRRLPGQSPWGTFFDLLVEFLFELVRRESFPHMLSRFSAFFALDAERLAELRPGIVNLLRLEAAHQPRWGSSGALHADPSHLRSRLEDPAAVADAEALANQRVLEVRGARSWRLDHSWLDQVDPARLKAVDTIGLAWRYWNGDRFKGEWECLLELPVTIGRRLSEAA
jgi:hypothetical protein